jgi:secreted Zn-dependent insulinase-like peptidase
VERFLLEFREDLSNMEDNVFMENVVGVAKTKLEKFNSLEDECSSLWSEIMDYNYEWEAWRNDVLSLRSMTKADVLNKFDQWLSPESKSRRIIIVQAIGTTEGAPSEGRPVIEPDEVWCHIDNKVKAFHAAAGQATWGAI